MAPFQLDCVGVGSENVFSNRSFLGLMGTPKLLATDLARNKLTSVCCKEANALNQMEQTLPGLQYVRTLFSL